MAGKRNSYEKQAQSQSDYGDNGGNKRINPGGREIIKQLRVDTKFKIRIDETVSRCEELVVTIYNFSDETNAFDDSYTFVSPTQDALFRVHDKVVSEKVHSEDFEEASQVTVQLL
ncbi:hypothetical protein CK203_097340 [Vitis vinifera]|uniref:Uncharacterized protein n=1 Tax=Vitis vinifera TaxID=29760 RepID=A0A438D663_VITVI|nr:hypothetical protein CK203_097340 [Vitis vinifera]